MEQHPQSKPVPNLSIKTLVLDDLQVRQTPYLSIVVSSFHAFVITRDLALLCIAM
jgi:hypothetical protein